MRQWAAKVAAVSAEHDSGTIQAWLFRAASGALEHIHKCYIEPLALCFNPIVYLGYCCNKVAGFCKRYILLVVHIVLCAVI